MQDYKKKNIKNLELIPTIIQDHRTNEVLMLAYMSEESLKKVLSDLLRLAEKTANCIQYLA